MHIGTLKKVLQHCNIGFVFFFIIAHDAIKTVDVFDILFSGIFELPIYPIYPFFLIMTMVNLSMADTVKTSKTYISHVVRHFNSNFLIFYVFLCFQFLLSIFSIDQATTLKSIFTYFVVFSWGYSLLFIVGDKNEEFNRLYIKYWIYLGFFIASLSFLLYVADYSPKSSHLTATTYELESIFPGFPAMRGVLGAINTTFFTVVATFLYMTSERKIYLRYFFLIVGFLLTLLMMKRTGLIMFSVGILLFYVTAFIERKYTVAMVGIISICIIALSSYNFIVPVLTAGDTQFSLKTSSRAHIFETIADVLNNRPIIGYGFGAAEDIVNKFTYGESQSDNSFITILVGTGIVGLTVYIIWLIQLFVYLFNKTKKISENKIYSKANLILFSLMLAASLTGDWINNISVGFPFIVLLIVSSMRTHFVISNSLVLRK